MATSEAVIRDRVISVLRRSDIWEMTQNRRLSPVGVGGRVTRNTWIVVSGSCVEELCDLNDQEVIGY